MSTSNTRPRVFNFGSTTEALSYMPPRKTRSNKGDYGRVLCVCGSRGMAGAAYLAAKDFYFSQRRFQMGGERYKRSRYPGASEEDRLFLDRKHIYFECEEPVEKAFSPALVSMLKRDFKKLVPALIAEIRARKQ